MPAKRPTPIEQINEMFAEFQRNNPATHEVNSIDESDSDVRLLLLAFAHMTTSLDEKIEYQNNDLYQMASSALLGTLAHAKPRATLVQFTPFEEFPSPVLVKKGMRIEEDLDQYSEEEQPKRDPISYATCHDFTLYPYYKQSCHFDAETRTIHLQLQCVSPNPASLDISTLALHCVGAEKPEYSTKLFMLLLRDLDRIIVRSGEEEVSHTLDASALKPTGFSYHNGLFTQQPTDIDIDNWGSYFLLPEKLQSFALDCRKARHIFARKSNLVIIDFVLKEGNATLAAHELDALRINVATCSNLFAESAGSRLINHQKSVVHLQSKSKKPVHSVAKVFGVLADGTKRNYHDINDITLFSLDKTYAYNARLPNTKNDNIHEVALELAWGADAQLHEDEAITALLYCTDGAHQLSANLSRPMVKSGVAQFNTERIGQMSHYVPGLDSLRAVSVLLEQRAVNQFTLQTATQLRKYLQHIAALFVCKETKKDIDGILNALRNVTVKNDSILHKGRILYGQEVVVYLDHKEFPSNGNIYLFGYLLNALYASFTPFNYYSSLVLKSSDNMTLFEYDVQIGSSVVRDA